MARLIPITCFLEARPLIPLDKCPKLFIDFLDQRRFVRPVGKFLDTGSAKCDIGAIEYNAKPACGSSSKGFLNIIPLAATKVGTAASNIFDGTSGPDRIHGLGGHDTINGLGGDDLLCGGPGDDELNGGDGDDIVGNVGFGGEDGDDILSGGKNDDLLLGDVGNDELLGQGGDDTLRGGRDDDILNGGGGVADECDGGDHVNGDTAANCENTPNVP